LLVAKEFNEWTSEYLPKTKIILEWGCGVSRIIRHYKNFIDENSTLHACDINKDMISWNKANIPNINFELIEYLPPTHYKNDTFNLVFGLSVFTHIESRYQKDWIKEIARITKPQGIFLFTTHGTKYFKMLNKDQLNELEMNGSYTISYNKQGHRMMTTYNKYESFANEIENYFEIKEFYNGEEHIDKVGGQDLWIVQKKI